MSPSNIQWSLNFVENFSLQSSFRMNSEEVFADCGNNKIFANIKKKLFRLSNLDSSKIIYTNDYFLI